MSDINEREEEEWEERPDFWFYAAWFLCGVALAVVMLVVGHSRPATSAPAERPAAQRAGR
jgi:hypothetical protein